MNHKQKSIGRLDDAINDAHEVELRTLRYDWPVLWSAIEDVLDAHGRSVPAGLARDRGVSLT